jgi:hypothetical protein
MSRDPVAMRYPDRNAESVIIGVTVFYGKAITPGRAK